MPDLILALLYGAVAGLMIPLGGLVARIERLQPRWLEQEFRHSMIAFGGGLAETAQPVIEVESGPSEPLSGGSASIAIDDRAATT